MNEDISLLLTHLLHPGVVLGEELYDTLLREVLDLEDFVGVTRIILEGSVEVSSACADSGDAIFFE